MNSGIHLSFIVIAVLPDEKLTKKLVLLTNFFGYKANTIPDYFVEGFIRVQLLE